MYFHRSKVVSYGNISTDLKLEEKKSYFGQALAYIGCDQSALQSSQHFRKSTSIQTTLNMVCENMYDKYPIQARSIHIEMENICQPK